MRSSAYDATAARIQVHWWHLCGRASGKFGGVGSGSMERKGTRDRNDDLYCTLPLLLPLVYSNSTYVQLAPFAGPVLGPIVSGYTIVGGLSWRWTFWILACFVRTSI
jgi:hypothetical protein